MKKRSLLVTLFLALQVNANPSILEVKISDFKGVEIHLSQPVSFRLGKYSEDAKAEVAKGEVQYLVNYDLVLKAKEDAKSSFCTFSVNKVIKHKTRDYAQASNEIIEILQQKKAVNLEAKDVLTIQEASLENSVIVLKLESKKENRIIAECITPEVKDDEDSKVLLNNLLETLNNNQIKLRKKGKDFPAKEKTNLKKPNTKGKKQ